MIIEAISRFVNIFKDTDFPAWFSLDFAFNLKVLSFSTRAADHSSICNFPRFHFYIPTSTGTLFLLFWSFVRSTTADEVFFLAVLLRAVFLRDSDSRQWRSKPTHLPLSAGGTIFRTYVRTSRKPARHPWIRPRGYWHGRGGASGGAGGWGEGYCA